jgi:hypothetical protein
MRLSTGISSSEEKSTTHMSPIERRYTNLIARAASRDHSRRGGCSGQNGGVADSAGRERGRFGCHSASANSARRDSR